MSTGSALIPEFRGVNLSKNAMKIPDSDLRWAANCYPVERGVLDKRPNGQLLGAMPLTLDTGAIDVRRASWCGLIQFYDHLGKHHLFIWQASSNTVGGVGVVMNEILSFNEDGSTPTANLTTRPVVFDKNAPNDSGTVLMIDRAPFRAPTFLVRNGVLYVFWGQGTILTLEAGVEDVLSAADGGVGAGPSVWRCTKLNWNIAAAGTPPELVSGFAACEHNGQLVMAGVPEFPTEVFCADPADTGDLTLVAPGSRAFSVGAYDGDPIIAVVSVPVLDGANSIEPYLLVLKRRSVWMVQGFLPTSTSDGDLRITPVLRTEGCVSKSTVVVTPSAVVWCSGKNVWRMVPGNKPEAIGNDIAPYLKTLSADEADPAWWACWDTTLGCYRLSVPRGRTDVGMTWESYLGYSTHSTEQWWCDLRDPEAPAWWGPQLLTGTFSGMELREPGGTLLGTWIVRDEVGGALRTYLVTMSSYAANWADFQELIADAEQGAMSAQRFETKEFDFGDPFVQKILEAAEVYLYATPDDDWAISGLMNWGRSVKGLAPPATAQTPAPGFELDVGKVNTDKLTEGFEALAVYPASSARATGRTFTLRFTAGGYNRIRVGHFGVRVRVIGRRPTNNRQD